VKGEEGEEKKFAPKFTKKKNSGKNNVTKQDQLDKHRDSLKLKCSLK